VTQAGTGLRLSPEDRFAAALDRLVPEGVLGVAVSGGPDSLALLWLAAAARPGRVRAATIDHGLRPESAGEAAVVAGYCAQLAVPHDTLRVTVAPGASLQAQAREARYAALGDWAQRHALAAVATGHHADDQAETLLMRLARGSGVGGLRGIREERLLAGKVRLVRPLLAVRKAELKAVVKAAGWFAVDDPSNGDERHDRTRVRALLAANPWLDPERLARSARALGDADDALRAQLHSLGSEHLESQPAGTWVRAVATVPGELRRRLLLQALEAWDSRPSGPELDRVIASLSQGRTVTIGAAMIAPVGGDWRVGPAPPRRQSHP
jgi:tRNA(Ile)-lysidine synthase